MPQFHSSVLTVARARPCGYRWSLASAALSVIRSAILSGAVATPGAAGPKAAGAAGGIMVTTIAARVIHHLATAGHGYLSSVLPPPAGILQDMAEQQAGSSELLAAGSDLAEQLLLLVSVVLPAAAHLSPEMPLQQYWGAVGDFVLLEGLGSSCGHSQPLHQQ